MPNLAEQLVTSMSYQRYERRYIKLIVEHVWIGEPIIAAEKWILVSND